MTDSEKLDLILQEMQILKTTVNRMDKQVAIISNILLSPQEVQNVKKAK